ncbi:hypothetical protein OPV22_019652 [Ensete ventricosum]|uniref:Uncharacterized protein n=1 Tax=Ensete ventricosum TaxID=4639 RepID=A0AAV8P9H6_ENSVE|nr:hypothetical protein OPV22_019652 [Ensete ventricosum]
MEEVESEQQAVAARPAREEERHGTMIVTFPDAARRRAQSFPPPLRLEGEESNENMSHRNVWQVYALGSFMILRWIWARWRERRDRGK